MQSRIEAYRARPPADALLPLRLWMFELSCSILKQSINRRLRIYHESI